MSATAFLFVVAQASATPAPGRPTPSAAAPSAAPEPDDRFSVLHTMVVAEGETVGDALCLGCAIVVNGRVLGDATAILGGVDVTGQAGHGTEGDVIAVGGGVHVGAGATVPASIVSLGGPVRIDPGATASYDVDSLPWLHVPGQLQLFLEGAASLVAFVLVVVLAGAALVRAGGIASRDAALASAPVARGLMGGALLAAYVCAVANGQRLGRFEDVVQSGLGIGFVAALVLGSTGVASLLGRGAARLAGRRLAPGWRSAALGAAVLALLCLVPLLGAPVAFAALVLACGGAFSRRGTLTAPSPDEVAR
jgi:hypothetical protein